MEFREYESLEDLVKTAEEELLLSSVIVDKSGSVLVDPVTCPGKGRKNDMPIGKDNEPKCLLSGKVCPYFGGAEFTFENYIKKIICKVI